MHRRNQLPDFRANRVASMLGDLTVRSGRVKRAKRLATRSFRAESGEFLAEGPQAVREALIEGLARDIFVTPEAHERHADLPALDTGDAEWHLVDDEVLMHVADAVNPQGIVARCIQVQYELEAVLADNSKLILVCAEIRDPGNAGSVIRAADAAGADAVIFAGDSVDPWNPKVVRASVGSVFHIPIVVERDILTAIAAVNDAGLQVLAADGTGDIGLFDVPLDLPTAWLMGNEAWGLPEEIRGLADQVVSIPIYGRAESLNLATAATLCLYTSAQAQR